MRPNATIDKPIPRTNGATAQIVGPRSDEPGARPGRLNGSLRQAYPLSDCHYLSVPWNHLALCTVVVSPVYFSSSISFVAFSGVSSDGTSRPTSNPIDTDGRTYFVSPASRVNETEIQILVALIQRPRFLIQFSVLTIY